MTPPITEKLLEIQAIIRAEDPDDNNKTLRKIFFITESLIEKPAEKCCENPTTLEFCTRTPVCNTPDGHCHNCGKLLVRHAPKEESSMGWKELWKKHHYLKGLDRVGYIHLFNDFEELLRAELARQREEIAGEIGKALEPSFLPPIPETNEYANGWNDCRKEARKNRDKLLRFLASIARNHTP